MRPVVSRTLLAGRGKSPPDVFPRTKTSGFHGCCAPGIASLRPSRLFFHSLLAWIAALAVWPPVAGVAADGAADKDRTVNGTFARDCRVTVGRCP